MNVFLLQLRSLLDGAEITATAVRSRSFRAIFPLKHQIVSRSAALLVLWLSKTYLHPRPNPQMSLPSLLERSQMVKLLLDQRTVD